MKAGHSISSIRFELSAGLTQYLRSSDPVTYWLYALGMGDVAEGRAE